MRADPQNAYRVLNCLTTEPIVLDDLAHATGLPRRRVEEAIEAIRREGQALVCSDRKGVWLPATVDEYAANVETRRRRFVTQAMTVRAEKRLLRRLTTPGQGRLWM